VILPNRESPGPLTVFRTARWVAADADLLSVEIEVEGLES
jgi:hypothetical protein